MAEYKILNRLTGQVETLSEDEAAAAIVDGGGIYTPATEEEIIRDEGLRKYGSTGDQALGALEATVRTGSFGLIDGFGSEEDVRGRENVLKTESPGVAFASQALGSLVPGLGAAKVAVTGAKALGAGARATSALTALAEGGAVGTAEEVEQARYENRDVSVGNILLYGIGGELAGRAIPMAARKAFRSMSGDATSAIAGEAAENLAVRAEQQSLKRAALEAADMPKGPKRDEILARTADAQYDRAAREARTALDGSVERFALSNEVPKGKYKQWIAPDAPVQMRWGTETSAELDNLAKTSKGATRETIENASQALIDSNKGLDTFLSAKEARKALMKLPASAQRDAAESILRQGTERVDLWGKAAEFEADMNRTISKFDGAKEFVQKNLAQGDAFDPAKIRNVLKQDKIGRGLTEERIEQMAQAVEDRIALATKYNTTGVTALDAMKKDVNKLRGSFAIADDVQAAVSLQDQLNPKAPKGPRGFSEAAKDFAVDRAAGAVGAGIGGMVGGPVGMAAGWAAGEATKRLLKGVSANGRAAIASTARKLIKPVVGESWSAPRVALTSTALSRFTGEYPGYRESYEAKKDILTQISQDPGVLAEATASSFGLLPSEDPELFMKLSARLGKAYQYVTDNLPASVAVSMLYPRGTPPSQDSIREFAIIWNSAMQPETVLDDINNGTCTPTQVKVLRDVHPDIYAQLLDDVVTEVSTNFAQMDSQTKVWLDILFDADGLAGPGFSSKAADYIQQSMRKPEAQMSGRDLNTQASNPTTGIQNIKTSVTNRGA
jgi:hypothetical protein